MAEKPTRLTYLDKGELFEFEGNYFEKLERRERGKNCKNMKTGEVVQFPLMLNINKVEAVPEDSPKKIKRNKKEDLVDESQPLSDSVRLRDGWEEPTDL